MCLLGSRVIYAEELPTIVAQTQNPHTVYHFFLAFKDTFPLGSDHLFLTYLYLQLYVDTELDSSSPRGNVTWRKKKIRGSMFLIKKG